MALGYAKIGGHERKDRGRARVILVVWAYGGVAGYAPNALRLL
jgi:hypothetical protein